MNFNLIKSDKKLNQDNINNFEKEMNISLPNDYKKFLLKNNGGIIKDEDHRCFYYDKDKYVYIFNFFSLNNILVELEYIKNYSEINKNWIPIASDKDTSFLFISLENDDNGYIYYYSYLNGNNIDENSILISKNLNSIIDNLESNRSISEIESLISKKNWNKLKELIKNNIVNSNTIINNDILFNNIISKITPPTEYSEKSSQDKYKKDIDFITFLYKNSVNLKKINLYCHHKIIEIILDLGYDINQQDENGKTQLMKLIDSYSIYPQRIELLLEKGSDINIKDNEGNSVYDYLDIWLKEKRLFKKEYNDINKILKKYSLR